MVDNRSPDWTVLGAAVAGIITALGGVVAVLRRGSASTAPTGGTALTEQTLTGLSVLLKGLQDEIASKNSELDVMERRATDFLTTIADLRRTISDLERQIQAMGWPPPGNPPAALT